LPVARQEFDEAFAWYEARRTGLGISFRAETDRQVSRIGEHPHQFPLMHADIRRARLRRFPYALFFRIDGDDIFVIACFHARRNPATWQERV
jgi:plasmid stabilization system protein ParE